MTYSKSIDLDHEHAAVQLRIPLGVWTFVCVEHCWLSDR